MDPRASIPVNNGWSVDVCVSWLILLAIRMMLNQWNVLFGEYVFLRMCPSVLMVWICELQTVVYMFIVLQLEVQSDECIHTLV